MFFELERKNKIMALKNIIIACCVFVVISCRIQQFQVAPEIEHEDSTMYEVVVFDNGFETWYAMRNSPTMMRSIDYYRSWNQQYVRTLNTTSFSQISFPINYEADENYPLEIEHKLYYYFQYIEKELRIPILNGFGRRRP